MKTTIKWYDGDLFNRLKLALHYLEGMLDASADNEPFFGVNRGADGSAHAHHALHIGIPHVTGRACDIMFDIEHTTGQHIDPAIEAEYVRYLFSCCEVEDFLPVYYDPARNNRPFVEFHNLRECMEALVWLCKLRDDKRARRVIDEFLNTLLLLTDPETGCLSAERAAAMGPEKAEKFATVAHPLTLAQGRLVGPLLLLYRQTGDRRALQLATAYARSTLCICFHDDGRIADAAHNHVHSITSSLTGILSYACFVGNGEMIDKVRRIYLVGLHEAMSDYGYVKEQLWIESQQGESNQVGDCIQLQLMLAGYGSPAAWYARAERFMRGGILPAQMIHPEGFITNIKEPKADCETRMADRAIGGFGFPTPTSRLEHETGGVNTIDITQGAVQSICRFVEHIAVQKNGVCYLNLYFGVDNAVAQVSSGLPVEGTLRICPKVSSVWALRIPENSVSDSFTVTVNGQEVPYTVLEGYAYIDRVEVGQEIVVCFTPQRLVERAWIGHHSYDVRWFGEQVVEVLPYCGNCPLYGDFPVAF